MNTYREHLSDIYTILTNRPQIWGEKKTHAGLWLDKYLADQKGENEEETKSRHKLVDQVSTLPIPEVYNAFYQRWEKMLQSYLKDYNAQTRVARVKGRMIIGLGDESVLETSVTLHRTYGVPYIPGSALKGLAANYARHRLSKDWQEDSDAYKVIFGDTDEAGYIVFLDALYIPGTGYKRPLSGRELERPVLYPDVITVHHQNYYQNKNEAPSDRDSPNPVPFLSATGSYLIALAAPDLEQWQEWIKHTFDILGYALKTLGIGAKTSSGYGRMELRRYRG